MGQYKYCILISLWIDAVQEYDGPTGVIDSVGLEDSATEIEKKVE